MSAAGGFNGGGQVYNRNRVGYSGGGASDIRINSTSLYARVIVAGGGGGRSCTGSYIGGYGGGTNGGNGSFGNVARYGQGGSQTSGGATGICQNGETLYASGFGNGGYTYNSTYGNGGGGGWYGGGAASADASAGGGSGYVLTSSSSKPGGYLLGSQYYMTNAATYAGNTSFTSTSGGTETGHSGNGYARITVVE